MGEADKEFTTIITLIHDCEQFAKQYNVPGATINPYTNLTGKDVQSKWNEVKTLVPQRDQTLFILYSKLIHIFQVKTLVPQRDQTLQDELKKQENNEALRRQFAEKSNQVIFYYFVTLFFKSFLFRSDPGLRGRWTPWRPSGWACRGAWRSSWAG